jgi:ABC-2 type transport system permease protein
MPLVFSTIPLVALYSIRGISDVSELSDLGALLDLAPQLCGTLNQLECAQFLMVQQFMVLFLMLPVIIPVTIASYSIVGEKTAKTLEPWLATPISTTRLLAGKALAAAIPSIGATLLGYAIFSIVTLIMARSSAVAAQLFAPLWLLGIFVVGPLLSIAGVSVAVMISSRVNDPHVAEQVSALVMLPILAVFIGQIFSAVVLNMQFMILIAIGLAFLDAALIFFAAQLFQRESIITRWK